jgi:hypothetical protein
MGHIIDIWTTSRDLHVHLFFIYTVTFLFLFGMIAWKWDLEYPSSEVRLINRHSSIPTGSRSITYRVRLTQLFFCNVSVYFGRRLTMLHAMYLLKYPLVYRIPCWTNGASWCTFFNGCRWFLCSGSRYFLVFSLLYGF